MNQKHLVTDRLILIPMNYNMICSIIDGTNDEFAKLGLFCGDGWPRQDTFDIIRFLSKTMKEGQEPSGFEVWLIARKDGLVIIGDAGFTGPPEDDGKIEIGYGLIESERQNGYGYEAAKALIEWAIEQSNVKKICAGVLADNWASIRILEKLGMREIQRDKNDISFEMRIK